MVGGGGAPGVALPGWAVALPADTAEWLRRADPPVVARIEAGRCLLDLRCVDEADDELLVRLLTAAGDGGSVPRDPAAIDPAADGAAP